MEPNQTKHENAFVPKQSAFPKVLLALIALCTLIISASTTYQVFYSYKQLENTQSQLEEAQNQLAVYENQVLNLEKNVADLSNQLKQYEQKKQQSTVSSSKAYLAWLEAQTMTEPHDLYDDLVIAYQQLVDCYAGTHKYKTALALLVPKQEQNNADAYIGKLDRYLGAPSTDTAINRFLDDLVAADLLKETSENYYSWNTRTLNENNTQSKLNLTADVTEAMFGLLRAMDWNV